MSREFTAARLLAATATAAVAGLVLAGCAPGADTAAPGSTGPESSSATHAGTKNDADITFTQGMIPHHRQAVEVAELAVGSSGNPKVLDFSARIEATQGLEIETMTGWLQGWGQKLPPKTTSTVSAARKTAVWADDDARADAGAGAGQRRCLAELTEMQDLLAQV